jgi:hypothetical protein
MGLWVLTRYFFSAIHAKTVACSSGETLSICGFYSKPSVTFYIICRIVKLRKRLKQHFNINIQSLIDLINVLNNIKIIFIISSSADFTQLQKHTESTNVQAASLRLYMNWITSGPAIQISISLQSLLQSISADKLKIQFFFYYLNIFIHGSLSVACFSKGRGLKLLKRYKTKSKPKL